MYQVKVCGKFSNGNDELNFCAISLPVHGKEREWLEAMPLFKGIEVIEIIEILWVISSHKINKINITLRGDMEVNGEGFHETTFWLTEPESVARFSHLRNIIRQNELNWETVAYFLESIFKKLKLKIHYFESCDYTEFTE